MDKLTLRKRFSAAALAAALALAVCVPATAFADTQPSWQDGTAATADNTTTLTLQYDVPLEVTNYSQAVGNTKVLVPAKINFVAAPNASGYNDISAPTDAIIQNYSPYRVHISKITLTGIRTGLSFTDSNITSATAADQVKLSVTPGNGSAVSFTQLSASGGYDVANTTDWNLAAKTDSTVPSIALNFSGQCSPSLTTIDPNTQATIGTIGWTVAAGNLSTVSGG